MVEPAVEPDLGAVSAPADDEDPEPIVFDPRLPYLEVDHLQIGLTTRWCAAAHRRFGHVRAPARRVPGHRRRVRLGQDDAVPELHGHVVPLRGGCHRRPAVDRGPRPDARADEKDWRPIRGRAVGYVPQSSLAGLNPVLTVETQLLEALHLGSRKLVQEGGEGGGAATPRHGPDPARRQRPARTFPPAVGRHAPARDDRRGPRPEPAAPDPR